MSVLLTSFAKLMLAEAGQTQMHSEKVAGQRSSIGLWTRNKPGRECRTTQQSEVATSSFAFSVTPCEETLWSLRLYLSLIRAESAALPSEIEAYIRGTL